MSAICLNQSEKRVETEYLRIHIRANSNDFVDQSVKYMVKTAVVEYLTPFIAECDSKEKAQKMLSNNLNDINKVADSVLKEQGFNYTANSSIKNDISFEGLNVEYQEYGTSPKVVCAVCLKEDKKSVIERLTQSGYLLCPYDEDITASQKILELEQKKAGN